MCRTRNGSPRAAPLSYPRAPTKNVLRHECRAAADRCPRLFFVSGTRMAEKSCADTSHQLTPPPALHAPMLSLAQIGITVEDES